MRIYGTDRMTDYATRGHTFTPAKEATSIQTKHFAKTRNECSYAFYKSTSHCVVYAVTKISCLNILWYGEGLICLWYCGFQHGQFTTIRWMPLRWNVLSVVKQDSLWKTAKINYVPFPRLSKPTRPVSLAVANFYFMPYFTYLLK